MNSHNSSASSHQQRFKHAQPIWHRAAHVQTIKHFQPPRQGGHMKTAGQEWSWSLPVSGLCLQIITRSTSYSRPNSTRSHSKSLALWMTKLQCSWNIPWPQVAVQTQPQFTIRKNKTKQTTLS